MRYGPWFVVDLTLGYGHSIWMSPAVSISSPILDSRYATQRACTVKTVF